MTPQLKYELELWVNGIQVGDVSRLAKQRKFTIRRNASEDLTFSMDLTAFEQYCESAGRAPNVMLDHYVTDVRVKRNGVYLFGAQVVDTPFKLAEGGAAIDVRCTGFLDLFKDRYLTESYPDTTEATDIVRDAIEQTQSGGDEWDFGVLPGVIQYDTGVPRERNYVDQNIRDLIVNLTSLIDGNFDIKFNYDRTYEIFEKVGSDRPSKKFTYPYNIKGMDVTKTALNLYNYIIGLGSGFGEETLRSIAEDLDSQLNRKVRQKIVSFNSVSVQGTLDDNTDAYLQRVKDLLLLPKIKVSGEFADLSVIGIGDRVPVEVQNHAMLPLNDTYRIEQIDCALDDNDAEDIDLTIDDYGL